jgi:type IV pilus assembly protein PilW
MNKKVFLVCFSIRRQRGLTLVELMVSLVISSLLLAGVGQIYLSSRQTYRINEGLSRVQENGRFAMEFLSHDIRMADFWGCTNGIGQVTNNLDPANGGANQQYDFGSGGLAGIDGGAPGASDTIILRGAFGEGLNVQPPFGPQASADVKVPPNSGLSQGDILIVSDCTQADIFQITNSNPDTSGQLVHNTGNTVAPGNYNASNPGCPGANAHCLSKVYSDEAQVFRVRTIVYTIGPGASGQPALFRQEGANNLELVDGVTSMQVLYGEDTDAPGAPGYGTADYYVRADQVTDMENVVSLQISLLTQSYDGNLTGSAQTYTYDGQTLDPGDDRLYQVFNSTVTIRNRVR